MIFITELERKVKMSKNLMEEFLSDLQIAPNNAELIEISQLANQQLDLQRQVVLYGELLDSLKDELKNIQEKLLPEAMAMIGLSEFKLADGSKITIKDEIYASIRADKINNAVTWLDSMGLGDIVKDDVTVKFGRGDGDKAKDIVSYAQAQGYNVSEKLSIHPQTLKALVKEQLARGVEFPDEFFSVNPVKKSIIKTK